MTFQNVASPLAFERAGHDARLAPTVALIAVAAIVVHLIAPLPGDVSWLLTVCERMFAGQKLYVDITELNPPMSPWLYMPWVWLAPRIGVSPETLVVFATVGAGLAAAGLAARTLAAAGLLENRAVWWIVVTLTLTLAPVYNFAQREHIAVIAALPMLAAIAARADGRTPGLVDRVLAGLGGGLTMAIKPHFALAILLPAAFAAVRRRSVRPLFTLECVVAGAVFAAYSAAVVIRHPLYFSEMLPVAAAIYLPNRLGLPELFCKPLTMMALLAAGTWIVREGAPGRPLAGVLAGAMIGFFIAYLIQGRGWAYHVLPVFVLASIAFGLSFASPGRAVGRRAAALTTLTLTLLLASPVVDFVHRCVVNRPLVNALEPLGPHLKIELLSDDIAIGSPLHRSIGATLVNRGPSLWLVGNAFEFCLKGWTEERKRICRAADALERKRLLEDMRRQPPDAIVAAYHGFDWLEWARADPETSAFLDGYRVAADVGNWRYDARILVRADRQTAPASP